MNGLAVRGQRRWCNGMVIAVHDRDVVDRGREVGEGHGAMGQRRAAAVEHDVVNDNRAVELDIPLPPKHSLDLER